MYRKIRISMGGTGLILVLPQLEDRYLAEAHFQYECSELWKAQQERMKWRDKEVAKKSWNGGLTGIPGLTLPHLPEMNEVKLGENEAFVAAEPSQKRSKLSIWTVILLAIFVAVVAQICYDIGSGL